MNKIAVLIGILCAIAFSCGEARGVRHGNMLNNALRAHFSAQKKTLSKVEGIEESWFNNKIDHFKEAPGGTFPQLYFVNSQFATPNGPVFFILGGEGPLDQFYVTQTMFTQYAQRYGGYVIALEHRFYGKSIPNGDLSTDNLTLLSAQQALADAAWFRTVVGEQLGLSNNPWIVCGGSYSGNLSSWARQKFPNLFIGAVSSSAPVEAVVDFFQYLNVVSNSLSTAGSPQCLANALNGVNLVSQLTTSQSGLQQLSSLLNTCAPIQNTQDDIANLMSDVIGSFMGVVQYNSASASLNITGVCNILAANPGSINSIVNLTKITNQPTSSGCLDVSYSSMISSLQNTSTNSGAVGGRAWTYQTCTSFGYFQTTDQSTQQWGNTMPLQFSSDICDAVYGISAQPNVEWTNAFFGGNTPATPSKIIYPNGSLDPWHVLSYLNKKNNRRGHKGSRGVSHAKPDTRTKKSIPTEDAPMFIEADDHDVFRILIDGGSHCQDWIPAGPNDPPQLKQAQDAITEILGQWISDFNDHAF